MGSNCPWRWKSIELLLVNDTSLSLFTPFNFKTWFHICKNNFSPIDLQIGLISLIRLFSNYSYCKGTWTANRSYSSFYFHKQHTICVLKSQTNVWKRKSQLATFPKYASIQLCVIKKNANWPLFQDIIGSAIALLK